MRKSRGGGSFQPRTWSRGIVVAALAAGQLAGGATAEAHTVVAFVPVNGAIPTAIAVGSFGGPSGCKDLAVAENASSSVRILEGSGACTVAFIAAQTIPVGLNPTSIVVAQLDAGNVPDLAVTTADSDEVWVLYGNAGLATFTPRAAGPIHLAAGSHPRAVVVGNWDGSGLNELAVANGNADTVTILDDSAANFALLQTIPIPSSGGAQPDEITVGQFNGDGDPDLAVSNYTGGTVSILLGAGGALFGPSTNYPAGPLPVGIIAASLNTRPMLGDTFVDIVVANRDASNPTVSFLKGNGDGTFQPRVTSAVASVGNFVNGVGTAQLGGGTVDLDLAVVVRDANFTGVVWELAGDGLGGFLPMHSTAVGNDPGPIAISQLIQGGAPDFAIGTGSTVAILQG